MVQEEISKIHISNEVDLTNCDREPIHIPGSIQPHGVLFFFDPQHLIILQVSDNTEALLGTAPEMLLGEQLSALFSDEQVERIVEALSQKDLQRVNPLKMELDVQGEQHIFDAVLHRSSGGLILELEPAQTRELLPFARFSHIVSPSTAQFQQARTLGELCQMVVDEVRSITGFDRVMMYRFDREWNGEVIAEALAEGQEPYFGLHYPASDIPRQARALYLQNWLRLIADVFYTPAPIIPTDNPLTGNPLDLSFSVLRSVSPMHIEYLKNMGVGASMSVSVIRNGQLWGLISCHHRTAKYVPYELRAACEFLGQLFSLQLATREEYEDSVYETHIRDVLARMLQHLLKERNFIDGLTRDKQSLLELVGARGAAICFENQYVTVGITPEQDELQKIVAWLQKQQLNDVFATNTLAKEHEAFAAVKDAASGLLAVEIGREQGNYVLWFRPEVLQIVEWGGDPNKPVEIEQGTVRLHPRKSFDVWKQTVQRTALPWKQGELDAVYRLRVALLDSLLRDVMLQRADELARYNEELERSNNELDSFAYIVSHDLKEPLRGIHNYARIVLEDQQERLDADGKAKVQTLVTLSERMEQLIDSLLYYSRVGRVDLAMKPANLNEVVSRVLEILHVKLAETHTQVVIPRLLPTVVCDQARIGEVFQNLITNALKYNDRPEKRIEIGYRKVSSEQNEPVVFYVRDNGIGIREKHHETIFRIFKRLHGRNIYGGGSGAGLTIVKKIVERHGGRIWVESVVGEGSTFYFTLAKGG